ncbi:hypothetical protein D3C72_2372960 [compost metagenome]
MDEGCVLVVDHWGGALGIGKCRAGCEEGGETEDVHFHDGDLYSGLSGLSADCLAVSSG